MRSMASGAAFHRAYLHATQQAFRYEHLASAVRKIPRGHRARRRSGLLPSTRIGALRPSSVRRTDDARILNGRTEPVGAAMAAERDYLTARSRRGSTLVSVPDITDLDA